jgi:hypothetical protein
MLAIGLAEAIVEKFGGDCMADVQAGIKQYRLRIAENGYKA